MWPLSRQNKIPLMPKKNVDAASLNSPDLFGASVAPAKGRHVYTVSEITRDIKIILENTFAEVWVEAEISDFRGPHPSGHLYFSLKDEGAVLSATVFAGAAKDIKFKIENGLKVVCFGRIDLYLPHGKYKLVIEKVEPKGIGSLQLALEQLKKKLASEGLFAPERKRRIPYLPSRIGVVTSQSGAALKDILKVLDRRFCSSNIIVSPAQVQGEGAKEDISRAIEALNEFNESLPQGERIDVLIVGRGGGSMEDLWAFNEEVVVRAICASKIPVVSAVGHEHDWTIADLVADLRAPTPSAAAELVVPEKGELHQRLEGLKGDIKNALSNIALGFQDSLEDLLHRLKLNAAHILELSAGSLDSASRKLELLNPVLMIEQYKARAVDLARQICVRLGHFLKLKEAGFNKAVEKLSGLSPLNILGRGYSITFLLPQGQIIKDANALAAGDAIRTKLHKGQIISKVMQVE